MAAPKLYYFDGRGRAAIIRMALAASDIKDRNKCDDELLTEKKQLEKWRSDGLLQFLQVPMLEIDGLKLVQSGAIVRYLADKEGLLGSSLEETARINVMFEGSRDFMSFFYKAGFVDLKEVLMDASAKGLPRYLPIFDKALKENGSGFLVGGRLTLADIGLLEPILTILDYYGEEALKDYPCLQEFYKKVTSLPNMAEFLAGPQRRRPNDDVYVSSVKKILFS